MASRNDEAQIILLAGILLVIAFMLFSIQLSLLANIGQQTGRETETPLLEDYFSLRRSLQTYVTQEVRYPSTGQTACPSTADLALIAPRLSGQLEYLEQLESFRGQSLRATLISATLVGSNVEVIIHLELTNGIVTLSDRVLYKVSCM